MKYFDCYSDGKRYFLNSQHVLTLRVNKLVKDSPFESDTIQRDYGVEFKDVYKNYHYSRRFDTYEEAMEYITE